MFKLKLAVGGKHVQGNEHRAAPPLTPALCLTTRSRVPPIGAGSIHPGEALATALKAAPAAEPVKAEPVAPAAAPAVAAAAAAAPSAAPSGNAKATSSIGGINLSKVSLAPMGMTDRHGVSPAMLFPRAKPLERTQLNIGMRTTQRCHRLAHGALPCRVNSLVVFACRLRVLQLRWR